jgi:hypothetical protein
MEQHLRDLRVYYLAIRHRLTSNKLQVNWSEAFVIEWMKILRVHPFEDSYPLLARGAPCPRCPTADAAAVCTDRLCPGGARMRCQTCGCEWLEQEGPAWVQRRGIGRP